MKRYIFLIILIMFFNSLILSEENLKQKNTYYGTGDFSYDISGGVGSAINFFSPYMVLFFEFTFKFDYIFSKKINDRYRLGIGLSIGDSINVGGLFFIYAVGIYNFFNRVQQKITFVNMVGNDYYKKYALFEIGATISFTSFHTRWYDYYNNPVNIYYVTLFVAPYLFIGRYRISYTKNEITNIVGGFMEWNIDIGKYISPSISYMQKYYLHFSIGVEYRIGHHIKKFK